jgi:hypothetical protein
MKIKDGFLLRKVAGTNIVVPIAGRVIEFKGMITLNDVSADIWQFLKEEKSYEETVEYLISGYGIDRQTAETDLNGLLKQLTDGGVLV